MLDGTLKHEHVSAVEGALDNLFEGTPTFEVKIKVALEVKIEFHLKMYIKVHLLMQKSAQNDLIKGELEETLYVALEDAPKISL